MIKESNNWFDRNRDAVEKNYVLTNAHIDIDFIEKFNLVFL